MLKIYLARHGQDKDNAAGILNGQRDEPLTDLGRQQAKALAAKIKNAHLIFDAVYTSPLKRAKTTARIITETLNITPPIILPNLIERNFGTMTGKPAKDIPVLCAPNILQTDTITYFLSPEGAETFPDLMKRGGEVIAEVKRLHRDGNILLICHGDIGKMIYAA